MQIDQMVAVLGFLAVEEDGICIADSSSTIIYANKAFESLFGAELGGMVGVNIKDLIAKGQAHPHDQDLDRFMGGEPRMNFAKSGMMVGQKLTGEKFPLYVYDRQGYMSFIDGENRAFFSCRARLKE